MIRLLPYNKQKTWFPAIFISFTLMLLLLSACGSNATGSSGTGNSNPPSTPPVSQGYGTSHGCPSDAVVGTQPTKANVLLQINNVNSSTTAHVGDVIEIHLPFGQKWTGPMQVQGSLQLQQPAGYAWKAADACVWRFVATSAGVTKVQFNGQPICSQGKMCPMYIVVDPFTINVTA